MSDDPRTPNESASNSSPDPDSEFSRLFWAARKAQSALKGKVSDSPEHQSALAFAKAQGWGWAERLLEVSRLERSKEYYRAIEILLEIEGLVPERWRGLMLFLRGAISSGMGEYDAAIEAYRTVLKDPKWDKPGIAWNNLGMALTDKGQYDEAIGAFRKALGDPQWDTPGYAWYNLGVTLDDKGRYDEAIEAYRKALEDPNWDTPGMAWCNLGLALVKKGEYDEAINANRKALEDPKWNKPGKAWNNLGLALANKGKYYEAIEAYRKALAAPRFDKPAKIWANIANAHVERGEFEEAEDAFKKALASPDSSGFDHARARRGLEILKAKLPCAALSADDRAMVTKTAVAQTAEEPEDSIIAAINEAGDTQYDKYIAKSDSKRDNTLSILRGWSSAVTLLEGSERRWRGGGYFLKWRGYGIVVDPGFDFLRNFHDAGYHGREIDVVVVSHNHPDHNSDLKDIDDLRYELYKRLAATENPLRPYALIWDEDTGQATKFGIGKPQHHHPPITMASGYPQPFDLTAHAANVPVRIIPFNVNHGSDVPHAMGMIVELLDEQGRVALRIGYTADTEYFEELHRHLTDCDVLLAHISQPSIEELRDAATFKKVHLGYRGTARLIKECRPKLALIGEFWAGFTDLRIPLVKGLRQLSGVEPVLPAGLSMHLRLPSLEIECTECGEPTRPCDVKVTPPPDNFGNLAYLCPSCMIG